MCNHRFGCTSPYPATIVTLPKALLVMIAAAPIAPTIPTIMHTNRPHNSTCNTPSGPLSSSSALRTLPNTSQAHQQHIQALTSRTPRPQGPQPMLHFPSPVLRTRRIVAEIPATLVLKSDPIHHPNLLRFNLCKIMHPLCPFIHLILNNPIRYLLFQFQFHP
ncbi:hypothetical protein V6N13_059099 [Hibiscus sabdariffa]